MGDFGGPLTGPLYKAMQLHALKEDIEARRDEREMRRQKFQNDLEQQKRANALEDFKTRLVLDTVGGMQVVPGLPGNMQAAMGGRAAPVDVPGIGRYSLPTGEQRAERTGRLAGIETKAKEEAADPYEDIDLGIGAGTVKVPRSKAADALLKAFQLKNPHLQFHFTQPDDRGTSRMIGVNPTTGEEMINKEVKNAGKTARPVAGNQQSADKQIIAEVDAVDEPQRERRIGEMMPWAFAQLSSQPTTKDPEIIEKARKLAAQNVDNAIKQEYKQKIARARLERNQTPAAATAASQTTAAPRAISGQRMTAANALEAARRKGMTPNAFSQWWHSQGGIITP